MNTVEDQLSDNDELDQLGIQFSGRRSTDEADIQLLDAELYGRNTQDSAEDGLFIWRHEIQNREEYLPDPSAPSKSQYTHSNYYTASSGRSAYYAASSVQETNCTGVREVKPTKAITLDRLREEDEYAQILQNKSLWPVGLDVEQNWSGRGQHAEFQNNERKVLDELLQVQGFLGSSNNAFVQSVKCKRILLARKTIGCSRWFTKEQAIEEVAHLSKLKHPHIVQVIGTYVMGNELSVLLYPVAEYNLEEFLKAFHLESDDDEWIAMAACLVEFFPTFIDTLHYIHSQKIKHMDLKPKNILVRDIRGNKHTSLDTHGPFKAYFTDFGIARSYSTLEATETDGPTMFTHRYAAPEVVDQQKRGLSADIFSLGCIFVEIWAALHNCAAWASPEYHREIGCNLHYYTFYYSLFELRSTGRAQKSDESVAYQVRRILLSNNNGATSYQANIEAIQKFLNSNAHDEGLSLLSSTASMISRQAQDRPTAYYLADSWGVLQRSAGKGSESLQAWEPRN